MISLIRSSCSAGLIVLVGLAMSGCAADRVGTAAPVSGSSSLSAPPATVPPSGNVSDFGDLKACDLLTKVLQGKDFPPVQVDSYGGPNGCVSDKSMYARIGISLQVGAPYDQLDFDKEKQFPGNVNGRRAIQIRNGLGGDGACAVMLDVGPKSRALVNNVMSTGSTDEACELAGSIAKLLEPMLPKVR